MRVRDFQQAATLISAVASFNRITLSRKLCAMVSLLLLLLLLASALPTALYLRAAVTEVQFARLEASGVKPTVSLQNMVR